MAKISVAPRVLFKLSVTLCVLAHWRIPKKLDASTLAGERPTLPAACQTFAVAALANQQKQDNKSVKNFKAAISARVEMF